MKSQAERAKKHREKKRAWCIAYLGGRCVDCEESDPALLEFDHRGPKIDNITRMLRYLNTRNLILLMELSVCELRCLDCHAVRDGRLIRDRHGEMKREGKTSSAYRDDVPF